MVFNPKILEMVEDKIPKDRKKIFISMFGGNAHNALTLLEHPRPFDFVLPENPKLSLDLDVEIVPSAYVKSFLHKMAEIYLLNATTLRNGNKQAVYHFESPPPIGDNQFILNHLEQYFKDQSLQPKVAPSLLRYKLWRLHSELVREHSEAIGIEFVNVPKACQNEDGFLAHECYGQDSTHAGPFFGGLLLREFERRLGVSYDGWSWL